METEFEKRLKKAEGSYRWFATIFVSIFIANLFGVNYEQIRSKIAILLIITGALFVFNIFIYKMLYKFNKLALYGCLIFLFISIGSSIYYTPSFFAETKHHSLSTLTVVMGATAYTLIMFDLFSLFIYLVRSEVREQFK